MRPLKRSRAACSPLFHMLNPERAARRSTRRAAVAAPRASSAPRRSSSGGVLHAKPNSTSMPAVYLCARAAGRVGVRVAVVRRAGDGWS